MKNIYPYKPDEAGEELLAWARNNDPQTSHDAARRITPKVNKLEAETVKVLKEKPEGLTTQEISDATGIEYRSITPRMQPLVRKGLVFNSGARRDGRIVWKPV
jgi:hypothetical protein